MNLLDLIGKSVDDEVLSIVGDQFGPLRRTDPLRTEEFFSWLILFAKGGFLSLSEEEVIHGIHLEEECEELSPGVLLTIHEALRFGVSRETIRDQMGPPESSSDKVTGWSGAQDVFTVAQWRLDLEYDVETDCLNQVTIERAGEKVVGSAEDRAPNFCDDEPDFQSVIERTTSRPPRGLDNLRCGRTELKDLPDYYACHSTWNLACRCSSRQFSLLHDSRRLKCHCRECEKFETFFESSIHGLSGEFDALEGKSRSQAADVPSTTRTRQCGDCDSTRFYLILTFGYMDLDLQEDEPDLPGWDFFHELLVHGKCAKCSALSQVATVSRCGTISF